MADLEARAHVSERVARTVVIDWLCPYCGKANQNDDSVGNYPKCERCGERVTLVGRYAKERPSHD